MTRGACRSVIAIALWILVVMLVAACAAAGSSPATSIPPDALPAGSTPPASSPTVAPESAFPSASAGVIDVTVPTACLTLGPADCAQAVTFAAGGLPVGSPPARYVQVGPFGCATGERCPLTLAARPEGDLTIEFADGTATNIHLRVAADGSAEAVAGEAMGVAVEPTSVPLTVTGPVAHTLGHCGLYSGIDIDAAWWDPIGQVDVEHGDAVNATPGTFTRIDLAHATFTSKSGWTVNLLRREGPKLLPFCM